MLITGALEAVYVCDHAYKELSQTHIGFTKPLRAKGWIPLDENLYQRRQFKTLHGIQVFLC